MTYMDTITQQNPAEAPQRKAEPGQDLYNQHVEDFLIAYNEDPDQAFKRFGFSYLHSLQPVDRIPIYEKYKWLGKEANDFYNLGTVALKNEDFAEARKMYAKALKIEPQHYEANLNLALMALQEEDTKSALKIAKATLEFAPEEEMEELEAFILNLEYPDGIPEEMKAEQQAAAAAEAQAQEADLDNPKEGSTYSFSPE
jgi:tetratricopeptide (TPR) repeat protein